MQNTTLDPTSVTVNISLLSSTLSTMSASTINRTAMPVSTNTTDSNITQPQPLIFLQTPAAQGIAGTFAFAAILITVHQVNTANKTFSFDKT